MSRISVSTMEASHAFSVGQSSRHDEHPVELRLVNNPLGLFSHPFRTLSWAGGHLGTTFKGYRVSHSQFQRRKLSIHPSWVKVGDTTDSPRGSSQERIVQQPFRTRSYKRDKQQKTRAFGGPESAERLRHRHRLVRSPAQRGPLTKRDTGDLGFEKQQPEGTKRGRLILFVSLPAGRDHLEPCQGAAPEVYADKTCARIRGPRGSAEGPCRVQVHYAGSTKEAAAYRHSG